MKRLSRGLVLKQRQKTTLVSPAAIALESLHNVSSRVLCDDSSNASEETILTVKNSKEEVNVVDGNMFLPS